MESEPRILVRPAWLSLAAGVGSFFIVCVPFVGHYFAMACGIAGIVSGIQALRLIGSDPASYKGTGLAVAGIIASSLSTLVFWGLFLLQLFGTAVDIAGMFK